MIPKARSGGRGIFSLVTGAVMLGLGLLVALWPLFTHNRTVTGTRWLDAAFAIVFLLRGAVNIRTGLTRRRRDAATD